MAFALPTVEALLVELRTFVAGARATDALYRTNYASTYLPLGGRLSRDAAALVAVIDRALAGSVALRPERMRGL